VAYDAKFSRAVKGYDFGTEEQRQAREYIGKYFSAPSNTKHSKLRISGHVIISNNIQVQKIASFAAFLRSEGVIATDIAPASVRLPNQILRRTVKGRSDRSAGRLRLFGMI